MKATILPTSNDAKLDIENIAVIGLGYVGFPLSISLAEKHARVTGFDVSQRRVESLQSGVDYTEEVESERIARSSLSITDDQSQLADASFYIVTVPTPIDKNKRPDLSAVRSACDLVGPHLNKGDIVVFESTVYPGVTEDICGPLLAQASGLKVSEEFFIGYSPERINPGDKNNPLESIVKNVSGDTPHALERIAAVYEAAITAGIFRCSSIKVAEGAKVLENTQRDVNIALMNEMALICDRIGVNTHDVIKAASTKWNFLHFYPGLVGGHCIGVDPYYLASLSEEVGHHPEIILAGRRLNDSMPSYVANSILKKLAQRGGAIRSAKIGVLGITFKENVPDIRNSKSIEVVEELKSFGLSPLVHDPHADVDEARSEGIELVDMDAMQELEVMVLCVSHSEYIEDKALLDRLLPDGVLVDIKSMFLGKELPADLDYWAL